MIRNGFYIIKDSFFSDMSDPYLKGNKKQAEKDFRPIHFRAFRRRRVRAQFSDNIEAAKDKSKH